MERQPREAKRGSMETTGSELQVSDNTNYSRAHACVTFTHPYMSTYPTLYPKGFIIMKNVIKTLAIAGIGHIVIMNAGTAMSKIARKESVQNTKIGKHLYDVMLGASSASFAYGVIIDPSNKQEDVNNFTDDYLTTMLEKLNK